MSRSLNPIRLLDFGGLDHIPNDTNLYFSFCKFVLLLMHKHVYMFFFYKWTEYFLRVYETISECYSSASKTATTYTPNMLRNNAFFFKLICS